MTRDFFTFRPILVCEDSQIMLLIFSLNYLLKKVGNFFCLLSFLFYLCALKQGIKILKEFT
ncbi:hypothetical protein CAPGI0001_0179 [Capnocytophaga gingivalis ATCC 33624]|nr:hypothetical protein CAPGI0001_0179 [Capnocytophaga gingivalis ATCC 33624]